MTAIFVSSPSSWRDEPWFVARRERLERAANLRRDAPARQWRILGLRRSGLTLRAIAADEGVTIERIRQIIAAAVVRERASLETST